MVSTRPLHDPETGGVDVGRVASEAGPIAAILAGFGLVGGLVAMIGVAFAGTPLGPLLAFAGWLVAAVGAFVALLYVILRALQLSDRDASGPDRDASDPDGDGSGEGAANGSDAAGPEPND